MTLSEKTKYVPLFCLLAAMILWSSSFIALKIAFRHFDPMVVIFGRMFIASICFLFVYKRVARSLEYHKNDFWLMLFMAFCEPCLYFIFEAKALVYTTASQAGMITALLPILVMITATMFLKEKTGLKGWIGGLLAVLGVCWLTLESSPSENAPNPVLGNFLEFMAMVCATGYTLAMRTLTKRYSPLFLTAVQAVVGCLFYFPLLFLPGTALPTTFEPTSTLAVIYLGAVISIGAYGLYNYGLKFVPASKAASFVNLIPVFTVILSWLVLGEMFTLPQCMAAALVMLGVWLSQQTSYESNNG